MQSAEYLDTKVLQMMNFVLEMMDFVSKMMNFGSGRHLIHRPTGSCDWATKSNQPQSSRKAVEETQWKSKGNRKEIAPVSIGSGSSLGCGSPAAARRQWIVARSPPTARLPASFFPLSLPLDTAAEESPSDGPGPQSWLTVACLTST